MKKPFLLVFFVGILFSAVSTARPLPWHRWPSPRVALTFDDGPHPVPTMRLTDVLNSYRVPATFFVVGQVAERYPEILQLLVGLGHEVASHTWSHPNIRTLSSAQLRRELDRTKLLIQQVTGRTTTLFRTPGSTDAYLRKHFRVPAGYQLVLWNVHSLDQEGLSSEAIAERVLTQVRDGDIVLLHNNLKTTADALHVIIPSLKKRGFEFVTVSELLSSHGDRPQLAGRSAVVLRG